MTSSMSIEPEFIVSGFSLDAFALIMNANLVIVGKAKQKTPG